MKQLGLRQIIISDPITIRTFIYFAQTKEKLRQSQSFAHELLKTS